MNAPIPKLNIPTKKFKAKIIKVHLKSPLNNGTKKPKK